MTALMPRVAMRLLGDVAYPMRSLVDGNPLAAFTPVLPDGFRWAEDDEVLPEHLALTEVTLAELLCADEAFNPAAADDDTVRDAMHRELVAVFCDMEKCLDAIGRRYGDCPEATAWRMTACRARVEELVGTEAS